MSDSPVQPDGYYPDQTQSPPQPDWYQRNILDPVSRAIAPPDLPQPTGLSLRAIMLGLLNSPEDLKNLFTAPHDALAGTLTPDQVDSAVRGLGWVAGGGVTGAGRAALDAGGTTANMFVGPKAQSLDLDALNRAKTIQDVGVSAGISPSNLAEGTRQLTGWFQKPDGNWTYELSDHEANLNPEGLKQFVSGTSGMKLGDLLSHDDLFAQYPELRDLPLAMENNPNYKGGYWSGNKNSNAKMSVNPKMPEQDILQVLLHESQHAVQNIEGFTPGSNSSMFENKDIQQKAASDYGRMLKLTQDPPTDFIDNFNKKYGTNLNPVQISLMAEDIAKGIVTGSSTNPFGLNPYILPNKYSSPELINKWRNYNNNILPELQKDFAADPRFQPVFDYAKSSANALADRKAAKKKYMNTPGEIEARDTQNSFMLTPEQRAARQPKFMSIDPGEFAGGKWKGFSGSFEQVPGNPFMQPLIPAYNGTPHTFELVEGDPFGGQ